MAGLPLAASIQVQLIPSLPAPQPLGSRITWTATAVNSKTATAVNSNPGPTTYRFEVASPGSPAFLVRQDFSLKRLFVWTPNTVEGLFRIRVTARDYLAGETAQVTAWFQVTSRVSGNQAAVNPTAHPLVALFSAPTCPAGSSMRVSFQRDGSAFVNYTDWRPCRPGSMNFYVGGMQAQSTYHMNYEVKSGSVVTPGPAWLPFTTGALPATLEFPTSTVLLPPTPQSAIASKIILSGHSRLPVSPSVFPLATDLLGSINWYYADADYNQFARPLAGGTMLIIADGAGTGTGPWGTPVRQQLLREIDLAGNTLRETNADRISEQLQALGTDPIGRFHHDAIRLPNKNLLVLGDVQRIFPAGTQGSSGPVNIIGDIIIELDQNLQVVWYWNSFDHAGGGPLELDINRAPVRGELCIMGRLGCPPVLLASPAPDWLHANSLQYLPADGSLVVSLRNQDWVIKIDYGNRAGTGNVLWRLGKDGDFSLNSSDPYPWFSGQHEAAFESDGTTVTVFDNGSSLPAPAHSRGQVFNVNETARTASLALNIDLGVFAPMYGTAQRLPNGNYFFLPGYVEITPSVYNRPIEVTPGGLPTHIIQYSAPAYRSWRMPDLYTPPES